MAVEAASLPELSLSEFLASSAPLEVDLARARARSASLSSESPRTSVTAGDSQMASFCETLSDPTTMMVQILRGTLGLAPLRGLQRRQSSGDVPARFRSDSSLSEGADSWSEQVTGYLRRRNSDIAGLGRDVCASPEVLSAIPLDKYVSAHTLRQALEGGETVLVKGSWLLKRHAKGGLLPRRQELQSRYPAAIWKVDELLDLEASGTVSIVAVSYCWLGTDHPDPCGEQLDLLCSVLRVMLSSTALEDVALFIDWCSVPQKPRSTEEDEMSARARSHAHVWYLHEFTRVWMLTEVPDNAEHNRPYHDRGWPAFERALSEMVTKSSFILDLARFDGSCDTWDRTVLACKHRRRPPLLPSAFAEEMMAKVFSEGQAECDFVAQKYWEAFQGAISAKEELNFSELGWGDDEARQLAAALRLCGRLRKVALHGNRIGETGARALVAAKCPSLQEMWLTNNPVGRSSKDVRERLLMSWAEAGREPELFRL